MYATDKQTSDAHYRHWEEISTALPTRNTLINRPFLIQISKFIFLKAIYIIHLHYIYTASPSDWVML